MMGALILLVLLLNVWGSMTDHNEKLGRVITQNF